ncbi:MAG: type IV toxin-antitoxin system AbiEi family antitoxin [Dietzia sp.]|nr:type IV toxin-antitoxin system AbiEi family antitoxin [Dietzia sp.]
MQPVFIGSEALASGALTRATLRWNYRRLFPDVYTSAPASLRVRTIGAWLWTQRNGIVAGRAAAALHGARWVGERVPIEMIWKCGRPPPGVIARNERIAADELTQIAGLLVTTPERTALDLARHLPRNRAVIHLDALAQATEVKAVDVLTLAQRYPGALIERCGWFDLRVVKEHSSDFIKHRVLQAFQRRGYPPTLRRRS